MNESLDPIAVLVSLGWEAAEVPVPVTGGMDTAIWRFRTADGRWHALRVFRAEQAAAWRREQAAMTAAAAGGVPVPALEAAGMWRDRPAMVLSWAAGVPMIDALERRPWALWRLGIAFGRVQARIHAVPPPAELRRRTPRDWLNWASVDEPALVERLLALPVAADTLVHLDYHPLNVLVDGSRISAVIDWPNAAAGDRRADLARTTAILQAAPIPAGPLRPAFQAVRRLLYLSWRRGYRAAAGWPEGLAPFLAWAGATLAHDLAPRVGRFGDWVRPRDIESIRRWTARWKARAGVA